MMEKDGIEFYRKEMNERLVTEENDGGWKIRRKVSLYGGRITFVSFWSEVVKERKNARVKRVKYTM